MKLLDDRLLAFFEIARLNSFTKAAEALHLTQSALSHRMKKLESDLQVALFIRDPSGLALTEAGAKLLQYCRTQAQVEDEFLRTLTSPASERLSGALRIGSVSSLSWSVLIPAIADLITDNPDVHLDMVSREVSELPSLFRRGRFEFLVTIERLGDAYLEEHFVGTESYALIEPSRKRCRNNVFLDHDESDRITAEFFSLQGWKEKRLTRSYLDDNHGLVAGVQAGLGKAVVPIHLIKDLPGIRTVEKLRQLQKPVYLYYFKQPYYSQLHSAIVEALNTKVRKILDTAKI